jgi:hypothetical protein
LDQALIEEILAGGTEEDFVKAERVYKEGAFSWSYAVLSFKDGLPISVKHGARVSGNNIMGKPVEGIVLDSTTKGSKTLKVQYDISIGSVRCEAGGNPHPNLDGCKY